MPAEGDDAPLACVAVKLELTEGQFAHVRKERVLLGRADHFRSRVESSDEAMIHELSEYEARVLTEMIVIRARAKARIFQVLTPEQKALVSQKRRALRRQDGEELRGISVY